MKHRLALGLGKTVEWIEEYMAEGEFIEWMYYWGIEPWGAFAEELSSGVLASTVVNMFSKNKKYTPVDFMPNYKNRGKQDPRTIEQGIKQYLRTYIAHRNSTGGNKE